jgi:hypothetical protein
MIGLRPELLERGRPTGPAGTDGRTPDDFVELLRTGGAMLAGADV